MKDILQIRTFRLILLVFAFSLVLVPFSTCPPESFGDEALSQSGTLHSEDYNPLIIYYSRSGTSRIVADTLMEHLACPVENIQSTKNREGFLGVITCVLDQLLNRDDILEPLQKDPKNFNPIILVTPVWIGKLASPSRTCIKQPGFAGKDIYLMLTYNGSLTEEKEKVLREEISAQGITLKGLYKIITKEKTEDGIKEEVRNQLETKPLLAKVHNTPS
jgi:flavodoxin